MFLANFSATSTYQSGYLRYSNFDWNGNVESVHLLLFWKNRHRQLCEHVRFCIFRYELAKIIAQTADAYCADDSDHAKTNLLSWIWRGYYEFEYIHNRK